MRKIDWISRVKNKAFWISLVPALVLLFQRIASALGYDLDLSALGQQAAQIIEALFTVLAILGIVADPTTEGFRDHPSRSQEKKD